MFDQASRSLWLEDQLWAKLRAAFPTLQAIPAEVLITVGYPSSGARGRSEKIRPAEINYQWTGNSNEKAAIFVHPVYMDSPMNAMKAILFGGSKVTGGARWGPRGVGLEKNDDGSITATPRTQAILDKIIVEIGEPPAGFGMPFPVRNVDRARLRLYVNATNTCTKTDANGDYLAHPKIRAASDTLNVTCQDCGNPYVKA
jgi:hypothetical protein